MNINDLTPEQREKAKNCKTPEELLSLAEKEGYELSDDEVEAISGGAAWDHDKGVDPCPDNKPDPSKCPYYGVRTPG